MQALSSRGCSTASKREQVSRRQFEIAEALAAANNRRAIAELETRSTHDDRHLRGNVAFVLGGPGDPRGSRHHRDTPDRPRVRLAAQPFGRWTVEAQIRTDPTTQRIGSET